MATKDRTALKDEFKNGNLATGERFAELIDSMKTVQEPVADPAASGTSLSFIDSISQDADGKITATKKTLDLANAHELNPFKGWYKTGDTLPTDGFDGAYLYFKDTSEQTGLTTIYRWNGTAYADTGTVVDTSNVNTFETGQALNGVAIDGTGLANPASNALAKAEDAMLLDAKLDGFDMTVDKVDTATVAEITGCYYDANSSKIKTYNADISVYVIPVEGANRVRFLGVEKNGNTSNVGFGFGYFVIAPAATPTSSDFADGNFVAIESHAYNGSASTNNMIPIKKDVPNGATYLVVTLWSNIFPTHKSNFYCYISRGLSVKDKHEADIRGLDEEISNLKDYYQDINLDEIGTKINNWYIGLTGSSNGKWHKSSGTSSMYIPVIAGQVYNLHKTDATDRGAVYAFLASVPDATDFGSTDFAADFVSGTEQAAVGVGETVTVIIPTGCNYLYLLIKSSSTGSNRLPDVKIAKDWKESVEERLNSSGLNSEDRFNFQANEIKVELANERGTIGLRGHSYSSSDFEQYRYYTPSGDSTAARTISREKFPTSEQQKDAIDNILKLTKFSWTPKRNVPRKPGADYYEAGVEFGRGVPYSNNMSDLKVVGIHVSVESFMTAVNNPYSVLYTEHIATESNASAWGRVYENHNGDAYYGTVCCGFTSAALGQHFVRNRHHYVNAKYYGTYIPIAPYGKVNWDLLDIGDVFDAGGHSVIIFDILTPANDNGNTKVVIAECTSLNDFDGCRLKGFTASGFDTYINTANNNYKYTHYKCCELYKNAPLIDGVAPVSYNNDICTIYGDKVSLAKGELVVINYNFGTTQGNWTGIIVQKKGSDGWADYGQQYTLTEAETSLTSFYSENNITPNPYNEDAVQSGHALVLGYSLDAGEYRACMTDGTTNSAYTTWEVVDGGINDFEVTKNNDGGYTIVNNGVTDAKIISVIVGNKIADDYRGMQRWRAERPVTYFENHERTLVVYPDAMRQVEVPLAADIESSYPKYTHVTLVMEGKYGKVMTLPIVLPTE